MTNMTGVRLSRSRLAHLLQPVSLPLWICLAIVILLVMIDLQIKDLQTRFASAQSARHTLFEQSQNMARSQQDLMARDGPRAGRDGNQLKMMDSQDDKDLEDDGHAANDDDLGGPDEAQPVKPPAVRQADVPELQQEVEAGAHTQPEGALSDGEISALAQVLQMRMAQAGTGVTGRRNCSLLASMGNVRGTCIDTECPRDFHPSAEDRIRQLLAPRLRLTTQQHDVINGLAKDVEKKKYIFVTAASSNHYQESQALVYNLRKFIFNKLQPETYSFYYFDLGLKEAERRRVAKNCNCTLKAMDLKLLPGHARKLMCYAWKPVIIKALLPKAEVLVYMDVSVRFRDMDIDLFFDTARRWGAQFVHNGDSIPNHTVRSMFDFYGDMPCMYWRFPELLAGFSVFHNEPFMTKVVLEPWVSCALNPACMCPPDVDPHAYRNCPHKERRVGQCHRFDLSSLTIQMAKLYGDKVRHLVMLANNPPKIERNDRMDFFTD